MNEALVTVVIPVYNVEKYLKLCINSIVNQTYSNLEIILVDDGSTDMSGMICNDYKRKDPRIHVIHKKNGGLSEARNVAIDIASGQYITFVDSDDYVDKDYINFLLESLKQNGADISCCKSYKFYENKVIQNKNKNRVLLFSNIEAMEDNFYQKHIENNAWGKLYKLELFDNIRYPVGRLYEDLGTTYQLFFKAKKIVWNSCELYFYLQRPSSIMGRRFSEENMDRVELSEELLGFVQSKVPSIKKAAISRFFVSNIQVLREIPFNDSRFMGIQKKVLNNIQKYRLTVIFDRNAKFMTRLIALFSYVPVPIIQRLGALYKKIFK